MYLPKDIHKRLKSEAKLAGRTNADGLIVAPAWAKLFVQASHYIKRQEVEITRLRAENERLTRERDIGHDAVQQQNELALEYLNELNSALAENERLRGALTHIAGHYDRIYYPGELSFEFAEIARAAIKGDSDE